MAANPPPPLIAPPPAAHYKARYSFAWKRKASRMPIARLLAALSMKPAHCNARGIRLAGG
jgi:hypothetical protein